MDSVFRNAPPREATLDKWFLEHRETAMSKQCHEVDYTILGHDMQLVAQ
jgi:hypothetical protein